MLLPYFRLLGLPAALKYNPSSWPWTWASTTWPLIPLSCLTYHSYSSSPPITLNSHHSLQTHHNGFPPKSCMHLTFSASHPEPGLGKTGFLFFFPVILKYFCLREAFSNFSFRKNKPLKLPQSFSAKHCPTGLPVMGMLEMFYNQP